MERSLVDNEIHHAVKAEMESLMLGPRNKSFVFAIAFTLALLYLHYLHLCFTFIFTCYSFLASYLLVCFTLLIKKAIEHLNSFSREI